MLFISVFLPVLFMSAKSTLACIERSELVECLHSLDKNNDKRMTMEEIETVYNEFPWYISYPAYYFGSPNDIIKKCDFDQDGAITDEDMQLNNATCLADCFKRTMAAQLFC